MSHHGSRRGSFSENDRTMSPSVLTIYHNKCEMLLHLQSKFEEFRKADKKEKEKSTTQGKAQRHIDACNIVMTPLLEQVMPPMPAKLWEDLT